MKILLDHCVDRKLARFLVGHEVKTAGQMGWSDLTNGKLLAAAAGGFDLLLTVDRNMRYQQHLPTLPIAVVVLVAKSNRLSELRLLIPRLEEALMPLAPRTIVEVA